MKDSETERILLDKSIDESGTVELRVTTRLWNTKLNAPYCSHKFAQLDIINWLEYKSPGLKTLCPRCVDNRFPKAESEKRRPLKLGDFLIIKLDERDLITWVYYVTKFKGSPGVETDVKASVAGAKVGVIGILYSVIDIFYDNGWKTNLYDEDGDVTKVVPVVHAGTNVPSYWKTLEMHPLPDGIRPLESIQSLEDFRDLKNMRPGDHYEWRGFHFKFFDFELPEHMAHKSTLSHMQVFWPCVAPQFVSQAIFHSRHMLTISFLGQLSSNPEVKKEYLTAFLISEPTGDDVYHWVLCSGPLRAYKTPREYVRKQNLVTQLRPGFGVLLQAISAMHHKNLNKKNILLDSTEESFPYYTKLGYTHIGNKRYEMPLIKSNINNLWRRVEPKFAELENFLDNIPPGASYTYARGFSHIFDD